MHTILRNGVNPDKAPLYFLLSHQFIGVNESIEIQFCSELLLL